MSLLESHCILDCMWEFIMLQEEKCLCNCFAGVLHGCLWWCQSDSSHQGSADRAGENRKAQVSCHPCDISCSTGSPGALGLTYCFHVAALKVPESHRKRYGKDWPFHRHMQILIYCAYLWTQTCWIFVTAQSPSAAVQHGKWEASQASAHQGQWWKWVQDTWVTVTWHPLFEMFMLHSLNPNWFSLDKHFELRGFKAAAENTTPLSYIFFLLSSLVNHPMIPQIRLVTPWLANIQTLTCLFYCSFALSRRQSHIPSDSFLQFCSKSTAVTIPTPQSGSLWPPQSRRSPVLWPTSWGQQRTCSWSTSVRQEVRAVAATR